MSLALVQRGARIFGWLTVLVIVILSAVPGAARPHTGLPGVAEHFAIYLGVSASLAVGYERRVSAGVVAVVLALAAVSLEVVQMIVPNRHPSLLDIFASAAGAFAGAGVACVFLVLWRRYRP
jgi:VanZ family protein